jgi:hypothetical protein
MDIRGDVLGGKIVSAKKMIEALYKDKKTLKSTLRQAHKVQKKYYDLKYKLI